MISTIRLPHYNPRYICIHQRQRLPSRKLDQASISGDMASSGGAALENKQMRQPECMQVSPELHARLTREPSFYPFSPFVLSSPLTPFLQLQNQHLSQ